ncbi:MAG: porin [Bacteroidota bacterium]
MVKKPISKMNPLLLKTAAKSRGFVILFVIFGLMLPGRVYSQTDSNSAKSGRMLESFTINGFLSSAYVYNFNNPDMMKNQYRVFDFDDNSMKIDVLELSLERKVVKIGETGFRFDMTAGSSVPRISRSSGLDIGDLDFHQMYMSYIAPVGNGLKLDLGKFITSMGYEVIEGYDGYNDNYSRSFLFGYAIPFTHTGIKGSYAFSQNLSATLMVVNGWDNVVDSNKSKSVGGQLGVVPVNGMNLYFNYMIGPEKTNNNSDNRNLLDVVGMYVINEKFTLGGNGDYGTEQHSGINGGTAVWDGIAGYMRLNLLSEFSLVLRGEQFEDRDGIRTGRVQKLRELTLTPEYRVTGDFIVRADFRYDKSDQVVFQKNNDWIDNQSTVGINFIYKF